MQKFGTLKTIVLRQSWKREDKDFTPWLAKNLTLLSKALDMDLEFVDEHTNIGRYECDLLCRNKRDNSFVVVENQLEEMDHDHLGKALVYTTGLHADTVIWIAEDFTNEHRKTIDRLNEITHDYIKFFGVQLEVLRIDESACAPKFNIIVKPDNWLPYTILSDDYWERFKHYLEQHNSNLEVLKWTAGKNYLGFYLGYDVNDGQKPNYWIAAGKSGGFLAANFCIDKQILPDIKQWFKDNRQDVDQIFSKYFGMIPQRPEKRYIVVGVRLRLKNLIEEEQEFEWFHERLEILVNLFKKDGEINFLSDE